MRGRSGVPVVAAGILTCLVVAGAPPATPASAGGTSTGGSAVAASVAAVPAVSGPSRQTVASRFVLALRDERYARARTYVRATGPGGVAAVVARPWDDDQRSWDRVTGATCSGSLCFARGFPATPAPAWYVGVRDGRWRVVARAYLVAADYVEMTGTRGCLTRAVKVRNKSGGGYNVVLTARAGTPVRWTRTSEFINVALDVGWTTPRRNMVFGYVPLIGSVVGPCGE